MLDVRSGHQFANEDDVDPNQPVLRIGGAGTDLPSPTDGSFDYSRWRLVGMVYF